MKKILWMCLLIYSGSICVSAADLYTIPSVTVSAEDKTAVLAREVALKIGQEKAFNQLIQKVVPPEDLNRFSAPNETEILNFVQDVSVNSEKTTATKYMADIAIRFNREAVQSYLKQNHIPFLTAVPPVFVVVPVFETAEGNIFIFEEDNPVYRFLQTDVLQNDFYRFMIPMGDLSDISLTADLDKSSPDLSRLKPLLDKYQAEQVLLIWVQAGVDTYQIKTFVYPNDATNTSEISLTVPNIYRPDFLSFMWQEIIQTMESKWRQLKTDRLENASVYKAVVPVQTLTDWTRIKQKLDSFSNLQEVMIRALRQNQVFLDIHFKGSEEQLMQFFEKNGFQSFKSKDAVWLIDAEAIQSNDTEKGRQ